MKLWVKLVIGIQTFLIVFLFIFAKIKASEAEKQAVFAMEAQAMAMEAQALAEEASRLAQENAEMASRAQAEAEAQADMARQALEACESKKK